METCPLTLMLYGTSTQPKLLERKCSVNVIRGLWWWGRFGDVAEWLCFGFAVQWLFETLVGLSPAQQRQFLCFATGSPRLPIGGMPATTPPPLTRAVDGFVLSKWFWLRC